MGKWDVSLPPVKMKPWVAWSDLILLPLPDEGMALMDGPIKLFPPDPQPVSYPEPVSAGGYL